VGKSLFKVSKITNVILLILNIFLPTGINIILLTLGRILPAGNLFLVTVVIPTGKNLFKVSHITLGNVQKFCSNVILLSLNKFFFRQVTFLTNPVGKGLLKS